MRRLPSPTWQPRAILLLPIYLAIVCLPTLGCQQQSNATATAATDKGATTSQAGGLVKSDEAAAASTATGVAATMTPEEAPSVTLQLLDYAGIEQLVASHRGKVVVMDAWATSCPPCVREFPKLVTLSRQYDKDELACISLSFDYQGIGQPVEKMKRVTEFLARQEATFDNVLASEESDALYRKFHLASVPAVFVYDKAGALRHRFDNQEAQSEAEHFTYEDVGRLVAELVAEPLRADASGHDANTADSTAGLPPAGSANRTP